MAALTTTKQAVIRRAALSLSVMYEAFCDVTTAVGATVVSLGGIDSLVDVGNAPGIQDIAVDDELLRFSYLLHTAAAEDNAWRLIVSSDVDTKLVTVRRAFDGAITIGDRMEVYFVLSPREWLDAFNDAADDLFYPDRDSIVLVAGQREYTLVNWIQSEGQIMRMRFRDINDGALRPIERESAFQYIVEKQGVVTIQIPPAERVANTTLEVSARHYLDGEALDEDDLIAGVPEKLLIAKTKFEGLKKIFNRLGAAAKRNFGMQMVLVEREVESEQARWLRTQVKRDLSGDIDVLAVANRDRGIPYSW